jgi:prolipoprotein diacylglyceryltransferase
LVAAILYCLVRRLSRFETLRRLDLLAFAMPMAWMIGRLGCALAHDHPGPFSTRWIAVRFPEGARYDLGVMEFLFLIGVTATFHLLDRRPRRIGFYLILFALLYGSFRIWLNPKDLYAGLFAILVGLLVLAHSVRAQPAKKRDCQQSSGQERAIPFFRPT